MKILKKVLFTFITILLSIFLIINVYSFASVKIFKKDLPSVFGLSALEVISGSMEPTIQIGDLVLINTKDKNYSPGDIVTFYDKQGSFVTHRILLIKDNEVVTKGDNNNTEDGTISVDQIVGKCFFKINSGGKVIHAFKNPFTMIMIFIVGILACIFLSMDKNGEPIFDEEELELEEFRRLKEKEMLEEFEKESTSIEDITEEVEEDEDLDIELEMSEEAETLDGFEEEFEEVEEGEKEMVETLDNLELKTAIEIIETIENKNEIEVEIEEEEMEMNEMEQINSFEEFRKYKEQKELEEFRRYKEQKELEEFRKYKEQKELEEYRQFEELKRKGQSYDEEDSFLDDDFQEHKNNKRKNKKN